MTTTTSEAQKNRSGYGARLRQGCSQPAMKELTDYDNN